MSEISLRSANPYDFSQEELEQVASLLREEPELEVTVDVQPERGYGVTPIEVVVLAFIGKALAGGAIGAVGEMAVKKVAHWARARWRREKEAHPEFPPRPTMIQVLYGPGGDVLKEILIDLPDGEPREKTPGENSDGD
ncbi:hypothetical protein [Streptomyces sp. NBC_00986]|uniref:hypothetical protein n=1 Tax=Streptomyces sp. NBC_00986 TaxID=2903702 RepID=UPI003868166A|nr:hypothetical protein OG504_33125 [Streptomyces sp. NBC_00986]